jgi:hypothetical protein
MPQQIFYSRYQDFVDLLTKDSKVLTQDSIKIVRSFATSAYAPIYSENNQSGIQDGYIFSYNVRYEVNSISISSMIIITITTELGTITSLPFTASSETLFNYTVESSYTTGSYPPKVSITSYSVNGDKKNLYKWTISY